MAISRRTASPSTRREIGPGDLFVALKGEATDGHLFVEKALAAGAAGVLVSEAVEGPHVLVADTTEGSERSRRGIAGAQCGPDHRRHRLGGEDRDQGGALRGAGALRRRGGCTAR